MKKIRVAIVGYGNIGRYALQAAEAAPDMEVAGIVRRKGAEGRPAELADLAVVKDVSELGHVDVAILAVPTRSVERYALELLAQGINTVDSFDIHTGIVDLRLPRASRTPTSDPVAAWDIAWPSRLSKACATH